MSGPKRNPDKLNTIGVVVVGICGAVLVYVTIVALQAFYVDDTSEIQTMADYGGQDKPARDVRATQMASLTAPPAQNPRPAGMEQTYRIPLDAAIKNLMKAATDGKPCTVDRKCDDASHECRVKPNSDPNDPKNHVCVDLAKLVPAYGRADKPTVMPVPGRPLPIAAPPPPAPEPAPVPVNEGAGSGSGSAAPPTPNPKPVPTGGQGPGGGNPPGQRPGTTAPGAQKPPQPKPPVKKGP